MSSSNIRNVNMLDKDQTQERGKGLEWWLIRVGHGAERNSERAHSFHSQLKLKPPMNNSISAGQTRLLGEDSCLVKKVLHMIQNGQQQLKSIFPLMFSLSIQVFSLYTWCWTRNQPCLNNSTAVCQPKRPNKLIESELLRVVRITGSEKERGVSHSQRHEGRQ